jgi:hypothetical protein
MTFRGIKSFSDGDHMLRVRFESIDQDEIPASNNEWKTISKEEGAPDLIVWHVDSFSKLKSFLAISRTVRVLVVTHGDPTDRLVEAEISRGTYTDEERQRVIGCAEPRSIPQFSEIWADLVKYFSDGEPTGKVTSLLGLEHPVQLMAISAALQVAGRELARQSPRIERATLLEPALRLSKQCGRNDIRDHIAAAIADQDLAPHEIQQALKLLQGEGATRED